MQNLLFLFARVGNLILFAALEILCIYLIVSFNQTQKGIFINSSKLASSAIYSRANSITDYLRLGETNEKLAEENSRLLEDLINLKTYAPLPPEKVDSIRKFKLISAEIINNSIKQKNNKITLNKGRAHGFRKGMGVVNDDGLVGIIDDVSKNYSTAISLLNLQTNISVKLKKTNEIGELRWNGKNIKTMTMDAVPPHSKVVVGDSVITSGYSTIFPENIFIGLVKSVNEDKRNGFITLDVGLNNDLSKLNFVYVIENLKAEEQLELESDE